MANNNFQCLSNRNKSQRDLCLKEIKENEVDIYVLESRGLVDLWAFEKKFKGLNEQQIQDLARSMQVAEFVSSRGSLLHDMTAFYLLAEDLHKGGAILGKYEITRNGAQSYITFKGNHRLRSIIKGSRYLLNNAKIVALGVGQIGMKASARGGVFLTLVYSVPYRTLELLFKKDYLLSSWVVSVTSDVLKASIAAVVGYFVGTTLMATSGIVLVPIAIGLVAAFGVAEGLSYFEGKFALKEKVILVIDKHFEEEAKRVAENLDSQVRRMRALTQIQQGAGGVGFL